MVFKYTLKLVLGICIKIELLLELNIFNVNVSFFLYFEFKCCNNLRFKKKKSIFTRFVNVKLEVSICNHMTMEKCTI
jgi:hypothetical protein